MNTQGLSKTDAYGGDIRYKKCTSLSRNGIKKQEREEAAVVEKEINHDDGLQL